MTKELRVFIANTSFASVHGDANQGQKFRENHKLVKTYPEFFDSIDGEGPIVEAEATAKPGTARGKTS